MKPIRNTEQQSDHIHHTLSAAAATLLCLLPSTANCAIMMLSQNHFVEPD